MNDTISRQAVINVLDEIEAQYVNEDGHDRLLQYAKNRVATLPFVQPKIIRCKDCLMHGVCRFEQGLGLDGYCSQAERRI